MNRVIKCVVLFPLIVIGFAVLLIVAVAYGVSSIAYHTLNYVGENLYELLEETANAL